MKTEKIITVQRRLKLTPRTCASCGREFPGWGRQRFCSKPCQRRWDYRQHAEARRANRRESYRRQKDQAAQYGQSSPKCPRVDDARLDTPSGGGPR